VKINRAEEAEEMNEIGRQEDEETEEPV